MAVDLVLPRRCAACGRGGSFLCEPCEAALSRLEGPYCPRCAHPGVDRLCERCASSPPAFDGVRAVCLFNGAARSLVHRLKYSNFRAVAPDMARLLADLLEPSRMEGVIIAPVPLHPRRERRRGYNQSELLARTVGRMAGLPVRPGIVRRVRNTPPQVSIENYEERRANTEGSFACPAGLSGESVLLIDDVVTTGSTMSACAAALKEAGAGSVWGLAFARQS